MDNDKRRNPEKCLNNRGGKRNTRGGKSGGGQPKKDSGSKRMNFDNTREKKFEKDIFRSTDNASYWYKDKNGLAETAAGHVNFIHPTGYPEIVPNTSAAGSSRAIPGVMALSWSPIVAGRARKIVKQAMDSQLSFVVHKNSRNLSYDAQDMMMIELATGIAYSFLANMIRAYGTMRAYDGMDMYTPESLISAMGFDFSDLKKNYSHMLFDINDRISQMDQFWVPSTMFIYERWFWMNTNIYRDGDSAKSQYYLYVPSAYYVYNETGSQRGATLDENFWDPGSTKHTWGQALAAMDSMITGLTRAQYRGVIMGDILKAYGPERIYKINAISIDYKVEPTYSPEVLSQIENASITRMYPGTMISDTVTEDIYSQGYTVNSTNAAKWQVGAPKYHVLNFHQKESPSIDQVLVATRLTCYDTYVVNNNTTSKLLTLAPTICGTEIVTDANMYYYNWKSGVPTLANSDLGSLMDATTGESISFGLLYLYMAFDWAPWIINKSVVSQTQWEAIQNGDSVPYEHLRSIGDYDNYTFLQEVDLQDLHTGAIYGLFDVPVDDK